jgi:hypothetical protein
MAPPHDEGLRIVEKARHLGICGNRRNAGPLNNHQIGLCMMAYARSLAQGNKSQ